MNEIPDEFWNEPLELDNVLDVASHFCWIYKDDAELFEIFQPALMAALTAQKQLIIAVDEATLEPVFQRLGEEGFDIRTYIAKRQIKLLEPRKILLTDGSVEVDAVLDRLQGFSTEAKEAGWEGVSIILDTGKLVRKAPENVWQQYEMRTDHECGKGSCIMLCLYDLNQLSGTFVPMLLKTHKVVGLGAGLIVNPFYMAGNPEPV